jgi:hypothetical protein
MSAQQAAQRLVDLLPTPLQAPLAQGRIGGLPRGILAREIAPGTTGTQDVKEGIDKEPLLPPPVGSPRHQSGHMDRGWIQTLASTA